MMDQERWRRVEELYHSALERGPQQRHSFLVAACGTDAEILQEVETLLDVEADRDFVIDKPVWPQLEHNLPLSGEESEVAAKLIIPRLSPGAEVGPYVIETRLASGGMGEVYRARDTRLCRRVALKFLRADVADHPVNRRRFEAEARAVAALNHPNIVSIFDFGEFGGHPYAASELIEGESLRGLLTRGPVAIRKLIDIAVQIADGLAEAHVAGIAHRDLKPENIMISNEGRAKILDFGLAHRTRQPEPVSPDLSAGHVNLTDPGMVVGTPRYMSPEQACGVAVDFRSDQFSFGLVLYELATGKQAFAKATTIETLTAIVRDDPAPIGTKIPGPLRWIIDRCLAKEPGERYESTRDLYRDLRSLRDHLADAYSVSESSLTYAQKSGASRWWKTAAMAGATASILAFAALFLSNRTSPGVDLATYRYTPFAIEAKNQGFPIWSPDGKAVAYTASIRGQDEIFVRYLASPGATSLGVRRLHAEPRRWSADSRRIVAYAAPPDANPSNYELAFYGISAIGGDPAFITDVPRRTVAADFSPDFRTFAAFCQCDGSKFTVFFASPAGSRLARYQPDPFATTAVFNSLDLKFAPDGRKLLLLFTSAKSRPEVWILPFPPGSARPRRVLEDIPSQAVLGTASWMPDSRHIVFSMALQDRLHLWFADLASNERYQLTTGLSSESSPSVSPDGKLIAFDRFESNLNVISLSLVDGTPQTLLGTEANEQMAAWAARTEQLAYVTDRNGVPEVWVRSGAGSNRPVITKDTFPDNSTQFIMNPALSPDASRLMFIRLGGDGVHNWIMSLSDGVPHRLNESTAETEFGGTWSSDGRRFVYPQGDGESLDLVMNTVGSTEAPIHVRNNVWGALPDWSPTGEWISFQDKDGWELTSPDGKVLRKLGRISTQHLAFSKDGQRLYGLREEHTHVTLFFIDMITGKMNDVRELAPELVPSSDHRPGVRFSFAPDGKSMAYSVSDFHSSIWLLEGFEQPTFLRRLFQLRSP